MAEKNFRPLKTYVLQVFKTSFRSSQIYINFERATRVLSTARYRSPFFFSTGKNKVFKEFDQRICLIETNYKLGDF